MGVYSPTGGVPYLYIRYTDGAIYIQAWASALLVQLDWAMRRPSDVGRVTVWTPTLFHIIGKTKNSYGAVMESIQLNSRNQSTVEGVDNE